MSWKWTVKYSIVWLARPYHDCVRQVAVGLALQPHRVELRGHIAVRVGLVQSGPPDLTQLGGHKEWQDTLGRRNDCYSNLHGCSLTGLKTNSSDR